MLKIAQKVAFSWSLRQRIARVNEAHSRSIALMKFLAETSRKLGIGEHVYVVGGAVRNFVIEQPINDIDIVIDSVALGQGRDSGWFAEKLHQIIPAQTSFETNQYGVAILTVTGPWNLEGHDMRGEVIEIANARSEFYGGGGASGKGYKPSEVAPATIEEDLYRREFSFNTLLWQMADLARGPEKAEILDLTGCGLQDLKEGIMRCPSDPDKTFSDDPTRMLRAIKFFIRYGFEIEGETERAIRRNAKALLNAPQNAISEILIHDIMEQRQTKEILLVMKDLGLLEPIKILIEEDHAFRTTLENWASRNAYIGFLFDLIDMELPQIASRLRFLSTLQQQKLRQILPTMSRREAENFVSVLRQPGKVMDTREVIQTLGLRGGEIREAMSVAMDILISEPYLVNRPARELTDRVIFEMT